MSGAPRDLAAAALRALGIDNLVLVIHDAMFPSAPGEDTGRGSPYSRGARDLYRFARDLGFTGAQLGPQGETTAVNRSPYDGTVFSKSVLSIALARLAEDPAWEGIVDRATLEPILASTPRAEGRVHYAHAFAAHRLAVAAAFGRFDAHASPDLRARFAAFRSASAAWLDHDAAYEARAARHGHDDARAWPESVRPGGEGESETPAHAADRYAFGQFLVHAQHDEMRRETCAPGWKIFGDLQVGLSPRDRFRRGALFVDGYLMGAPPSRTDPGGQPWGYPVFDPASDAALGFLRARVDKMLREFDGVRIDHPHGLVCPWVYDAHDPDPMRAVTRGARMFASPDLADHAGLARFAIARADQLDRSVPRHADHWVKELDPLQVAAYARRFDVVLAAARAHGRDVKDIVCEVLSTQPYPLCRVMASSGLGRFRVTQKANPLDAGDVYRSENAEPADWIMVGNHDTLPLTLAMERWQAAGTTGVRARYLAERLVPGEDAAARDAFAATLARDPGRLAEAMYADLFASPARNVTVFVADLLGMRAIYNKPGVVDDVNWTLRVPNEFRDMYRETAARGDAMRVSAALALALRAKSDATRARTDLIVALEEDAAATRGG
jgi:4-alpha-glucanotransferase